MPPATARVLVNTENNAKKWILALIQRFVESSSMAPVCERAHSDFFRRSVMYFETKPILRAIERKFTDFTGTATDKANKTMSILRID